MALPYAEIVLGLLWITASFAPISIGMPVYVAGASLFLVFLLATVWAYLRVDTPTCNCFGSVSSIAPSTLVRNGGLSLLSSGAVFLYAMYRPTEWFQVFSVLSWEALGGVLLAIAWLALLANQSGPQGSSPSGSDASGMRYAPDTALWDKSGQIVNGRAASGERGALVLFFLSDCWLCDETAKALNRYREMIYPLDVTVIEAVREQGAATHNPDFIDYYGLSAYKLGVQNYPAALVLLPNTSIPVGPVYGPDAIESLATELHHALSEGMRG